jgi:precorrin-6B methylase 2
MHLNDTENTASNSPTIVVIGGYPAIARILLTCLPTVTKQRIFLFAIVAEQRYYTLQHISMQNVGRKISREEHLEDKDWRMIRKYISQSVQNAFL